MTKMDYVKVLLMVVIYHILAHSFIDLSLKF